MSRRMTGVAASAIAALVLVLGAPGAASAQTDADAEVPVGDETTAGVGYVGDAGSEALLVAAEERRLANVRAIANAADWSGASGAKPYRLDTGNLYTLVLVERGSAYTLDDLLRLAPRTFARQPDGSYLLSENIVVDKGASLDLSDPNGLELHLASTSESFVSIITLGGTLTLRGTEQEPATVTSWDDTVGTPDTDTTDGRSYIRVVGGNANIAHATFSDMGFWSGATGGLSLTGTDALDTGTATLDAAPGAGEVAAAPEVFGNELLPTGEASELSVSTDLTSYSYVSALIEDSTFDGNAFGLFISSAEGVVIRNSTVTNSLVDGIIMNRFVTNSEISRTTSTGNAMDGIKLTRGTSGVVIQRVTASDNGANGISVNGRPLADGPSAVGTAVGAFGNNEISDSTATDNARYGIDVLGGAGIIVDSNETRGNEMGIAVSAGALDVLVKNNLVTDSIKQGIALRNAGTDAIVQGNTVDGGEIGIYARDAGGTFENNTITGATNHGITLIGATGASTISNNTVSGSGPSGIDTARAAETTVIDNDVEGWRSTKPLDVILRGIFQPLTVMWLLLGLLLLVTAISSIGRKNTGFRHPYAHLAPLSSFTKGVVDRDALRTINESGKHV